MFLRVAACLIIAAIGSVFLIGEGTQAAVVEVGDLNIIDDAGNPSDGLRYLDMTYSDGLTQAAALFNAQATYPNARLATPAEFDDLFAAAGILYDGVLTASDAFTVGSNALLSSGTNYDGGVLLFVLGVTLGTDRTLLWGDADGDLDPLTTRDYLDLAVDDLQVFQTVAVLSHHSVGWLIVSAVPEPSSAMLMCLGVAGSLGCGWRRKRKSASEAS